MNINYEYYKIFYYVAKCGSFSKAAEQLSNNQPNITRTIKNLESALGSTLFIRTSKGVKLTKDGEALFQHVRIAIEQIEQAEKEITDINSLKKGTVSIGASEIALRCFLLPILSEFRIKHPNVRLNISNYSSPEAIEAVKNGIVDFSIATVPDDEINGLNAIKLKSIKELPVCSRIFTELTKKEITLSELSEYPIISLGSHTKTYWMYHEYFIRNGVDFEPAIEAATADQILPMVKSNLGIGFVPEDFLNDETENICLLKLKEALPLHSICLLRCSQPMSAAAKEFERILLGSKQMAFNPIHAC